MTDGKCDAMKKLQSASFALDELRLFLDTHPFESEAIKCFNNYMETRNVILNEYEQNYGPILPYNVKESDKWTWVESPWPWEGE